jgi:hypothetical protein
MRKIVACVGFALLLSVVVAPGATAAVNAGAACKTAGLKSVAGGFNYTCVKKSGKLVWVKGAAVKATMKPSSSAAPSASAKPTATASASAEQSHSSGYTMTRVKSNDTAASCWTVVSGNVYDLTKWISQHPGGEGAIKSLCGTDGTQEFLAMHRNQSKPEARLSGYLLGPLAK